MVVVFLQLGVVSMLLNVNDVRVVAVLFWSSEFDKVLWNWNNVDPDYFD